MRFLFYVGVALVLLAIGIASIGGGIPMDLIRVLDALFFRAALVVFLYLLWRLVRAMEGRMTNMDHRDG